MTMYTRQVGLHDWTYECKFTSWKVCMQETYCIPAIINNICTEKILFTDKTKYTDFITSIT